MMKTFNCLMGFLLLLGASTLSAQPFPFRFTKPEYAKYTDKYEGERFPDGRPKVAKDLLDRMKLVTVEEAWAVLQENGYECQFEGGWVTTHENPVLVGRAVTCQFIPLRPDVSGVIEKEAKKEGLPGRDKHWVMDGLERDDVLVADMFGRTIGAGFVGDNLANLIYEKTGTGIVVDGGCRDLAGVLELENFYVFNRNWDPSTSSAYDRTMIIGMNIPIRIGRASVLPGDVVLGLKEGVIFIPACLAREVVETSEIVRLKDEFGYQRLKEGKYTAGQIDSGWTEEIKRDFREWLKSRLPNPSPFQETLIK